MTPPPPPTWTSALFGGAFCSKSSNTSWKDDHHQQQQPLVAKIRLLDDKDLVMNIDTKVLGRHLLDLVCQNISLIESSYFGLEFLDNSNQFRWLDNERPVIKQTNKLVFVFSVKFYVPDPTQLHCEYTRYLFALQIRRDLAQGVLACAGSTSVLLASYIAQAEYGPIGAAGYITNEQHSFIYGDRSFFPHQTEEHEIKIEQLHYRHRNMSPAQADYHLLDIARKIDFYGLRLKPACDHDGIALELTVSHQGLAVFQGLTRINTFPWARIRKICFKRKKFLVKLQPDNYGYYKDTIEFYFASKNACKCFWKCCIENHSFFRLCIACKPTTMQSLLSTTGAPASSTLAAKKAKRLFLSKGSSFRYIGLTLKETVEQTKSKLIHDINEESSFIRLQSVRPFDKSTRTTASVQHPHLDEEKTAVGQDDDDEEEDDAKEVTCRNWTDRQKATSPPHSRQWNDRDCYSSTHGSRTLDTQSSVDMSSCSDVVALVEEKKDDGVDCSSQQLFARSSSSPIFTEELIHSTPKKDDKSGNERTVRTTPPPLLTQRINFDPFDKSIAHTNDNCSPVRHLFTTLLNLSDSTSSLHLTTNAEDRDHESGRLDVSSSPIYRTSSSTAESSPSSSDGFDGRLRSAKNRRRIRQRSTSRHSRIPPPTQSQQMVRQRRRLRHRSTTRRR